MSHYTALHSPHQNRQDPLINLPPDHLTIIMSHDHPFTVQQIGSCVVFVMIEMFGSVRFHIVPIVIVVVVVGVSGGLQILWLSDIVALTLTLGLFDVVR